MSTEKLDRIIDVLEEMLVVIGDTYDILTREFPEKYEGDLEPEEPSPKWTTRAEYDQAKEKLRPENEKRRQAFEQRQAEKENWRLASEKRRRDRETKC